MAKLVIGMLCLALCSAAFGGPIVALTLDGNYPADYSFYSYTDTEGDPQTIPAAPYMATLDGGGYNDPLVYVICYDFNSPTEVGTSYDGSFSTPGDNATLEATYLINELTMVSGPDALENRGALTTAIWEIMNPSSTNMISPFPSDPAAQQLETDAYNAVMGGSWTFEDSEQYPTWIPSDPSIQRFGVIFPPGTEYLPEPSSMVLMGMGMLCLGIIGRKASVRSGRSAE